MCFFRKLLVSTMLIVGMIVGAFPVYAAETNPAAAFPHRYSSFDLKVAWNAVQSSNGVVVSGLIKNLRYAQIEDVDVTIWLVDKDGKVNAVGGALPIPIALKSYEYEPFSAHLKKAELRPGSILRFNIRYRVNEGEDDNYTWMSNFAADAVSGALLVRQPPPSSQW